MRSRGKKNKKNKKFQEKNKNSKAFSFEVNGSTNKKRKFRECNQYK